MNGIKSIQKKKIITMQTECVLYHIVQHNNNIHTDANSLSLTISLSLHLSIVMNFFLICDTQTEYCNMLHTN